VNSTLKRANPPPKCDFNKPSIISFPI